MIPNYGNPVVDLLIKNFDCIEVVYTMTPSEKKTREDAFYKEIHHHIVRCGNMLEHVLPEHAKADLSAKDYHYLVYKYASMAYREVNK